MYFCPQNFSGNGLYFQDNTFQQHFGCSFYYFAFQNPQIDYFNQSIPQKSYCEGEKSLEKIDSKTQNKIRKRQLRNLKSTIAHDFIKYIKKSEFPLMVKQLLKAQTTVKEFKEFMLRNIQEGKYIRFKTIKDLWKNSSQKTCSKMFRILFRHFLKKEYPIILVNKKCRRRFEILQTCREIQVKLLRESF